MNYIDKTSIKVYRNKNILHLMEKYYYKMKMNKLSSGSHWSHFLCLLFEYTICIIFTTEINKLKIIFVIIL